MKKITTLLAITFCIKTNAQIITTVVGGGTNGLGNGGQATAAQLSLLLGVTFDGAGNLYIADSFNELVRKVNTNGVITNFAGNGFTTGHPPTGAFSGDNGPATAAELNFPVNITADVLGNIYIVDGDNYRIRKVNTAGIITTVAGNGTWGYSGDGGQATAAEIAPGEGVVVDAVGNLYFGDGGNNVIRKVNTAGIITTIAGTGTMGFSGDGGPATAAEFNFPNDLVFDRAGNLYIADNENYRIRKINTAGIVTTIAGNGVGVGTGHGGFGGDNGPATAAELNFPAGMAFDVAGNLFFADQDNNRVRKINTAGVITTVAGNGVGVGTICIFPNCFSGDGGQATAAELDYPDGIAIDMQGNLYIGDLNNSRVRKVDFAGVNSIEQYATNQQIKVYPNPATNMLKLTLLNNNEIVVAQVTDILGNELMQTTINQGQVTIDVSNLATGVYFIKTKLGTQKFIKQ